MPWPSARPAITSAVDERHSLRVRLIPQLHFDAGDIARLPHTLRAGLEIVIVLPDRIVHASRSAGTWSARPSNAVDVGTWTAGSAACALAAPAALRLSAHVPARMSRDKFVTSLTERLPTLCALQERLAERFAPRAPDLPS